MILVIDLPNLSLQFQVLDTPIARLWQERMQARINWPMDDADRFYGFNSVEQDQQIALEKIQSCVQSINAWQPLIERQLEQIQDQDTLNYLHSIFEQWHGLLNHRPQHPVYGVIPNEIRQHLANLNICVHRCESAAHGNPARFVCTWYGLPKTKTLPIELIQEHGTANPLFGSVCLNYAEIGKTLEDLARDRDNYISDEAFRPFNHYSADFVVRMYEESADDITQKISAMHNYYTQHRDFFFEQGYTTFYDPRLLPLQFPVAQLIETMPRTQLMKSIAETQHITRVTLQ
jgi:hypothetical protein